MDMVECVDCVFFFFKQKTAYEIYQCDWSSDVCSSDLGPLGTSGNLTKFFCGLNTPLITRLRAKKLSGFGFLEKYPFKEVQNWIESQAD